MRDGPHSHLAGMFSKVTVMVRKISWIAQAGSEPAKRAKAYSLGWSEALRAEP
jgi:hypothetical protein